MSKPLPMPNPKTISPIKEAERLSAALSKIDKREQVYVSNAATRYQTERNALMATATPAALRILEAAKEST